MAFGNGYIFGFATAVCVVCSISVAGVSMTLRERQEINKERDRKVNILGALGIPGEDAQPLEGEAIDASWEKSVEARFIQPDGKDADKALDQNGNGELDDEDLKMALSSVKGTDGTPPLLGLYTRRNGDKLVAVAIPMYGNGLWGPISGYLALDPNARTVTGVTFFAPKETPGLGAEIVEPKFKDQWLGKSVTDGKGGSKPVRVVKGAAKNICPDDLDHCVDGVSGATITSRGVDEMVSEALGWYDPFLSALRGG